MKSMSGFVLYNFGKNRCKFVGFKLTLVRYRVFQITGIYDSARKVRLKTRPNCNLTFEPYSDHVISHHGIFE